MNNSIRLLLGLWAILLTACNTQQQAELPLPKPAPTITVSRKSFFVRGGGDTQRIGVYSNRPWRIVVPDKDTSWIKVSPSSGAAVTKEVKVKFEYKMHAEDTSSRFSTIRFEQPGIDSTVLEIKVEQQSEYFVMQDSLAVIEFYYAMDGPNWDYPWDLSRPMSEWGREVDIALGKSFDGVWLGKFNGVRRVISIWFWYPNGLKGELPECLGRLTKLQGIGFHDDPGITGEIPVKALANCNMDRITAINCSISGKLSKDYNALKRMDVIELGGNNITGIEDGFGDLPILVGLLLGHNKISGPLKAEWFEKMPRVSLIDLSYNDFGGEIPEKIVNNKPQISMFALRHNRLEGKFPVTLRYKSYFSPELCCPQQEGYGFLPGTCQ